MIVLNADQPWVVAADVHLLLEPLHRAVEGAFLAGVDDPGLDTPTRCTGTPPSAASNSARVIVGCGYPSSATTATTRSDPSRSARRTRGVGPEGGVTSSDHGVLRGLTPKIAGDPAAHRQPEQRRLGQLFNEPGELEVRVVRGEEGGPQVHAPGLERVRVAVEQVLGSEPVAVRVDDVGAGHIYFYRSCSVPEDRAPVRTAIAGGGSVPRRRVRRTPRTRRVGWRGTSRGKSPMASRTPEAASRSTASGSDAGSCRTPRSTLTSSGSTAGSSSVRGGAAPQPPCRPTPRRATRRPPSTGSRSRRRA